MDDFSANSEPIQENQSADSAGKTDKLPAFTQPPQESGTQDGRPTLKRVRSRSNSLPAPTALNPKKKRFKLDRANANPTDQQIPLPADADRQELLERSSSEENHSSSCENVHRCQSPDCSDQEQENKTSAPTDRYSLAEDFMEPGIATPTIRETDKDESRLTPPLVDDTPASRATCETIAWQPDLSQDPDETVNYSKTEQTPMSWQPVFQQQAAAGSDAAEASNSTPLIPPLSPYQLQTLATNAKGGSPLQISKTRPLPLAEKQKQEHDTSAQKISRSKRRQRRQKFSLARMLCYLTIFLLVCLAVGWKEMVKLVQTGSNDSEITPSAKPNQPPAPNLLLPPKPVISPKIDTTLANSGWFAEKLPEGMLRLEREGEYLWQKDSSIMVYVPAGPFWSGSKKKKTLKKVVLSGYYIDKYELTNEQYLRFVQATGYSIVSPYFTTNNYNGMKQPVVGLNWYDANNYMRWAGKRLPTQSEWEKAARGGIMIPDWRQKRRPVTLVANPLPQRVFPWGDNAPGSGGNNSQSYANYDGDHERYRFPAPVGSFPLGVSPFACYDMAGNVWEWCADGDDSVHGKKHCCGGSWGSSIGRLFCFRYVLVNPNQRSNTIGVRFAY